MTTDLDLHPGEKVAAKFEAAWSVFGQTCSHFVAPEATYQAWFAHYLISQFGIDRVAREPNFKHRHFTSPWAEHVAGGEVKLDVVVTRQHGLALPHYVHRGGLGDGLHTLVDVAIISELKVAATQGEGLSHTEVAQDVYKLSMLLDEMERRDLVGPRPLAYFCLLDNRVGHRYNREWLTKRLSSVAAHEGVKILFWPAAQGPSQ